MDSFSGPSASVPPKMYVARDSTFISFAATRTEGIIFAQKGNTQTKTLQTGRSSSAAPRSTFAK